MTRQENETYLLLKHDQAKAQKNLESAQNPQLDKENIVAEYINKAKSLAEKMLEKLDPEAPTLEAELMLELGYTTRSYKLIAKIELANGDTLAVKISSQTGPEGSTASIALCRFSQEEIINAPPSFLSELSESEQLVLCMTAFPVDKSRIIYLGDDGEIRQRLKTKSDDAGLLSTLEQNIDADWDVLQSGFEDSGVLRGE